MIESSPFGFDEAGFRIVPPPIGACRWAKSLLVAEHIKDVPVFIGQMNERHDFVPHGTVFVVWMKAYDRVLAYFVTAKHVLDDIPGDFVWLRANDKNKASVTYIKLPKEPWQFHPDHVQDGARRNYIDVAVYPATFARNQIEVVYISGDEIVTPETIKEYAIGIGDEVGIIGLFYSHIGTERNVTVLRTGNIAAMVGERVPTERGMMEAYLIESRSIGGVSGSPVFLNMAARPTSILTALDVMPFWEMRSLKKSDKSYLLLGLVHGYYNITDQHEWVFKTNQQIGDVNTGITIVVPATKIVEAINPVFEREVLVVKNYDDQLRKLSGARTASAHPAPNVPRASDENPTHREDFTSLLGVAARKKPQDD
jgi:hypothetical protein